MQVIPCTERHITEIRRNLREGDKREILNYGLCIRDALWRSYNETLEPKAVIVEGQVAGVFGCCGTVLGYEGQPWLLTANIADKYPLQYALLFRHEVKKMLEHYDVLSNVVDATYEQAVKLLEMVGFKLYDAQPIGRNGALFRKFEMIA